MCNALSSISKLTIPSCRFRCSQEFIVPGINEHLKELHGKARECYLVWKDIVGLEQVTFTMICELVGSASNMYLASVGPRKR